MDSTLAEASIRSSSGREDLQFDELSRPCDEELEGSTHLFSAATSLSNFAATVKKSVSSRLPTVVELVLDMTE
jgi:hypothetical protein